jgi:hypothetical protein
VPKYPPHGSVHHKIHAVVEHVKSQMQAQYRDDGVPEKVIDEDIGDDLDLLLVGGGRMRPAVTDRDDHPR